MKTPGLGITEENKMWVNSYIDCLWYAHNPSANFTVEFVDAVLGFQLPIVAEVQTW